mmetsp:Transcript_13270/g.28802  ORF Transcript_13270/g.28802 Transcript_13270/m.28802 type:complete len:193 (-) Transcript_13270:59-637(-)|eukprot:CAMPEP_0178479032 /NCGR_PEP_ID=MMETSP0696-20121128/4969_1 /TAXON_ID=265572 /ORGANISM="Extubocellulus spinifer, Strain CCMP396" /LENGTH=192 /DNA_ID=CAMNT_0020106425 /DNA_START=240 /DNA_END=818 /DNA_ORIENTATION=-
MGNSASTGCTHQCCGVMDFAEQDINGGAHNAKKSTAIIIGDTDNDSIAIDRGCASASNAGPSGQGRMIYIEAREAGEACSSERGARRRAGRYRRKPSSIMVEGMPTAEGDSHQNRRLDVMAADSFSSISDAGVSIVTRLQSRIAPPQSTDDMSVESFFNDDATDYAICRTMLRKRIEAEARDDDQCEARDDV